MRVHRPARRCRPVGPGRPTATRALAQSARVRRRGRPGRVEAARRSLRRILVSPPSEPCISARRFTCSTSYRAWAPSGSWWRKSCFSGRGRESSLASSSSAAQSWCCPPVRPAGSASGAGLLGASRGGRACRRTSRPARRRQPARPGRRRPARAVGQSSRLRRRGRPGRVTRQWDSCLT
jgi:hypothetical protein